MSSPKHDRDSDRESLTDWTLVDREGIPDKKTHGDAGKDDDKDSGESSASPTGAESKNEKKEKEKNESGCGTEEEEGEEELSEDLISMGKRVQEIKASSGSDSSDIETLDCPGPDDFYEDHNQGYSSLHSSLFSSSLSGFTFVGDADEGDIESLASSDVMVLDQEDKGPDEETDLSLASSPSLPDDLPAIKPDTQYRHTPDQNLNSRLNVVVALTLACVLGLGLGHFLGLVALSGDDAPKGWSSRSMWQENINSAQIIEALNLENEELRSEMTRLQQENVSPIKISGKDGKIARDLRERITNLLIDNEELRVAVAKQQFDGLPEGDSKAFNSALGTNYKLRLSVNKLIHLVPDLTSLKVSANDLQKENQELQTQVGKLRYQEQPLPQELNAVAREVESLKKVVDEASKKKKAPPNFENAKIYLAFMSQVLQSLHDFKEGGFVEKLDVATDVFEGLVPGNVKPSASVQQKLSTVRAKFHQLQSSLGSKWEKIKDLGRPQNLARVSQDTLGKMNRVIVNVVNKMKDIGQASIMKRGKASIDSTVATLAQSLAALGDQFDKTWNNLEAEVDTDAEEDGGELLMEEENEGIEAGEEEEQELAVDDGDGEAEGREPHVGENEASEIITVGPSKVKKEAEKSGGSGEGGKGGGGRGGGGGDDKKESDEKESSKVSAEKKEDKHDGRRNRSRSRMSNKEEKEEQKEKKAKKKEEKAKKKKEKENKKSKKDKDDKRKSREEKENFGHKKEGDWSQKSLQEDDRRSHRRQHNKYEKKQNRGNSDDDDDDDDDDDNDDDESDSKLKRKYHKKKHTQDDDDDDDSDDKKSRKHHKKEMHEEDDDEDDKKKGLMRHWEKPSRKNYRREYPGPKKAFIRRRDN